MRKRLERIGGRIMVLEDRISKLNQQVGYNTGTGFGSGHSQRVIDEALFASRVSGGCT